jgi:hypothetical protein
MHGRWATLTSKFIERAWSVSARQKVSDLHFAVATVKMAQNRFWEAPTGLKPGGNNGQEQLTSVSYLAGASGCPARAKRGGRERSDLPWGSRAKRGGMERSDLERSD